MKGKWVLIAFFTAALVVFFFANRAAYKGYFSDDDLDNLGWPTMAGDDTFVTAILTPRFSEMNLRPIGDLYYRYLGRAFKLRFPPYVFVLQLLHVLNAVLLFCLLRRLDFSNVAAGAGALFYGLNAVILEAFWKPMYIFDVLCATFCLIALLFYLRGRWILALVPFWLAYKSKEIAVMLPVALLAYEWLLGERKWKRLIPYFLISLKLRITGSVDESKRAAVELLCFAVLSGRPVAFHCVLFFGDLSCSVCRPGTTFTAAPCSRQKAVSGDRIHGSVIHPDACAAGEASGGLLVRPIDRRRDCGCGNRISNATVGPRPVFRPMASLELPDGPR